MTQPLITVQMYGHKVTCTPTDQGDYYMECDCGEVHRRVNSQALFWVKTWKHCKTGAPV